VDKHFARIEQEKNVRIVYACESGSRAWGFPSVDSDYDVRFIYLNRPEWYLSINNKRDVIEVPINDNLDINGWDLKKALNLFRKSNPPLTEWLNSPIVYLDKYGVADKLRALSYKYYSQTACTYHYFHMARGNHRDYLHGETVWLKKYLYVLRPLLSIVWMKQGRGVVPTDFNVIVDTIDIPEYFREAVRELVQKKKEGQELGRGKKIGTISRYINSELRILERNKHIYPSPPAPIEPLNDLFISALEAVWDYKRTQ